MKPRYYFQKQIKMFFFPFIFLLVSLMFIQCNKRHVITKRQIILLSIDTLRADHLSSSGYFRNTSPNLSDLVKDSVYYTNAYPNGCWTMPSHMSLLTGTLPSRHGINKDWKSIHNKKYPELNTSIKNIAEILKKQGIRTLKFAQLPKGLGFARGFEKNKNQDSFLNEKNFNGMLKEIELNKEKDFFVFLHTWMVHAPYANSYYLKKRDNQEEKIDYINHFREICERNKFKEEFIRFLKQNNMYNPEDCVSLYDGGIRYVDYFIGRLIQKTKELGIYKDLMIVIVSDHGEHFNEHFPGNFYDHHGADFYEEFVKIPLVIKFPNETIKPKINNHPVSLVDVLPTILSFYNIKFPNYIQGNSLLKSDAKKEKYIISEAVSISNTEKKMILMNGLKYIVTMKTPSYPQRVNWDGIIERRLFDLNIDPGEKDNLYSEKKYRSICIQFEKMLKKIINISAQSNLPIRETEVSKETLKQMEALGYL